MQSWELGLKTFRGGSFLTTVAMLIPLASGAGTYISEALPPLPDGQASSAVAINARGEVADDSASFLTGNDVSSAVAWDRDSVPTALLALPGDRVALGINVQGDVIGTSYGEGFDFTAVLWHRHHNQRRGPRGERHDRIKERIGDSTAPPAPMAVPIPLEDAYRDIAQHYDGLRCATDKPTQGLWSIPRGEKQSGSAPGSISLPGLPSPSGYRADTQPQWPLSHGDVEPLAQTEPEVEFDQRVQW